MNFFQQSSFGGRPKTLWEHLHIDGGLMAALLLLICAGLLILYSAGNEHMVVIDKQLMRFALGFTVMFVCAQIPPQKYYFWAPWIFALGTMMLVAVLFVGIVGQGARRWIGVGSFRFQPSELMKIAVPMMLAWYFHIKRLPPNVWELLIGCVFVFLPVFLVMRQPDLGTALMIGAAGCCALFLAGVNWKIIASVVVLIIASCPVLWHYMHQYQKQRVLTFIDPERDPLGAGYHIIQSKIALGSGGFWGKGYLQGTQSHLNFLPEHATDFIFSVCGEELGMIGCIGLFILFAFVIMQSVKIAINAQNTFSRLLAGSLTLSFFLTFFVNVGMVIGILPVVGIPLPLVSYGGSSIITLMASFGVLMSISTHKKLISS